MVRVIGVVAEDRADGGGSLPDGITQQVGGVAGRRGG